MLEDRLVESSGRAVQHPVDRDAQGCEGMLEDMFLSPLVVIKLVHALPNCALGVMMSSQSSGELACRCMEASLQKVTHLRVAALCSQTSDSDSEVARAWPGLATKRRADGLWATRMGSHILLSTPKHEVLNDAVDSH